LAKFLWHRRTMVDSVRVLLLGVLPAYRMIGVEVALLKAMLDAAIRKGYGGAEMGWVLENNDAMNRIMPIAGSQVYKTYRIYDLAIG
jgi:GNAT superfamily N-acetyltransferase